MWDGYTHDFDRQQKDYKYQKEGHAGVGGLHISLNIVLLSFQSCHR